MSKSVASRIIDRIIEKLKAVDGTGDYEYDVNDRVYRNAIQVEDVPAFIVSWAAKERDENIRERRDGSSDNYIGLVETRLTVQVDMLLTNVDGAGNPVDNGTAIELFEADAERAIEDINDLQLADPTLSNKELLIRPLTISTETLIPREAGDDVETASISVICDYFHKIGDPSHVE